RGLFTVDEFLRRARSMPSKTLSQAYAKCEALLHVAHVAPDRTVEAFRTGLVVAQQHADEPGFDPGVAGGVLSLLLKALPAELFAEARALADSLRGRITGGGLDVMLARCAMRIGSVEAALGLIERIDEDYWRGHALRITAEFVPMTAVDRWNALRANLKEQG